MAIVRDGARMRSFLNCLFTFALLQVYEMIPFSVS